MIWWDTWGLLMAFYRLAFYTAFAEIPDAPCNAP